ncbi:unnamed protein product [Clavelina lepadiformis]|uniref:S1 motif domain-containing protein n=1 Tax=Clavelina lepadiformis TaxID=159417 RepID=A0ABP0FY80_CLALP
MSNSIVIRLPSKKRLNAQVPLSSNSFLITPGSVITEDADYMRGHGTYTNDDEEDHKLYASVAGVVERINKLVCVRALKTRYNGEVGDIVVGRIKEVQQKRWKVETNSRLDSVLHLSSVNLPGGELRRRSAADELTMREYLKEGDLISAEVQQVHTDGMLSLHTRSLKYGKLGQGCCVTVSPSLIKRRKNHVHNLSCGVTIILANNGYIWINSTAVDGTKTTGDGGFVVDTEPVQMDDREAICRVRNCILCLSRSSVMLYDTSVLYAYEASLQYQVKELLLDEIATEIVDQTLSLLERESSGNG